MDVHHKYLNDFMKNSKSNNAITKYYLDQEYVKGTVLQCALAEGIEMMFFDYVIKNNHEMGNFEKGNILEIFYCLSGKIIMEHDDCNILLKENMIGIYDFNTCPQRVIFEKGKVRGISLMLTIPIADQIVNKYLSHEILTMKEISAVIEKKRHSFFAFDNENLRTVFQEIVDNPFHYEKDYLLLKAMELILISSSSLKKGDSNAGNREKNKGKRICEKATSHMISHIAEPITMSEVAELAGVTERQMNRYFLEYTNQTAYAYLKGLRLQKARQLLLQTNLSIIEVAGESGWQNPSKFTEAFRKRYGMTPKDYRKENKII